jgi:hypothetical protein
MARLASGVVRQPTVREKRKRARAARLHAGSHQHSGNPGTVTVPRPRSRVVTLMLRAILEARALVALVAAAGVGTYGLQTYPVRPDEVLLAVIGVRTPRVFQVLVYGYGALSFTTPHYVASMIASLVTIIVYRRVPAMRSRPLPPYPRPKKRPTPMLVAGESHHHTTPGRAPQPTWLTIPQRTLHRRDGAGRRRHRKPSAACIRTSTNSRDGGATIRSGRSSDAIIVPGEEHRLHCSRLHRVSFSSASGFL